MIHLHKIKCSKVCPNLSAPIVKIEASDKGMLSDSWAEICGDNTQGIPKLKIANFQFNSLLETTDGCFEKSSLFILGIGGTLVSAIICPILSPAKVIPRDSLSMHLTRGDRYCALVC